MNHWLNELRNDLDDLQSGNLLRSLNCVDLHSKFISIGNQTLINLAANDYLALTDHPHLKQAAIDAINNHGVGSAASRLVTGHQRLHQQAERRFAEFKKASAALIMPTGFTANLAVLTTLAQHGDLICLDKLSHASLIDAARASNAAVRTYPHLQLDKLQRLLKKHYDESVTCESERKPRRFVVTDTVFSMDGDVADLPALCDIAEQYDAITVVDEAHATGLLGPTAAGLSELQRVHERIDVTISTASKALAGLGGVITADQIVIDSIVNHARSFIYTTAVPPAQVAVIHASLDIVRDEPWRREHVLKLAEMLRERLADRFNIPPTKVITPIVPLIVNSPAAAIDFSNHLRKQGFYAPAIRPPTVSPNTSRIRISLRADLTDEDIKRLIDALR